MLKQMETSSKYRIRTQRILILSIISILFINGISLWIPNKEKLEQLENLAQHENVAEIYERDMQITVRSSEQRQVDIAKINEISISKDMDLTKRCGISKEEFKEIMKHLKGDTSGFFYENSDTIYDLCQRYELNEVFFCGLIAAESRMEYNKKT